MKKLLVFLAGLFGLGVIFALLSPEDFETDRYSPATLAALKVVNATSEVRKSYASCVNAAGITAQCKSHLKASPLFSNQVGEEYFYFVQGDNVFGINFQAPLVIAFVYNGNGKDSQWSCKIYPSIKSFPDCKPF